MVLREVQPKNSSCPIDLTLFPRVTVSRDLQFLNALPFEPSLLKETKLSPNVTEVSAVSMNVHCPTFVTLLRAPTDVREIQPENA